MCGVVDGGITAGPVGLRGRPERRSGTSSAWFVEQLRVPPSLRATGRRRQGQSVHELPVRAGRAANGWVNTGCLPWTGTTATARCWSITTLSGLDRRADRGHNRTGRHLSRPDRGDRLRRRAPSSRPSTRPACRCTEFVVAGGLTASNMLLMQIYADVTPAAAVGDRPPDQGPALGARPSMPPSLRAPIPTSSSAAAESMGKVPIVAPTSPVSAHADVYDELFAEYTASCTTTSGRGGIEGACTG